MSSVICRCCGRSFTRSSLGNPNICCRCAAEDWDLDPKGCPEGIGGQMSVPVGYAPNELEQLLEVEDASVLECFNALEQAKQAIAETSAEEPHQSSSSR